MRKKTVIRNLECAREWIEQQCGKPSTGGDPWEAQNILVACVMLINQCGQSVQGWLGRKGRPVVLQDIEEKYNTKLGVRVLRDLIDLAISTLEACSWRDDFALGPLPIRRNTRKLTDARRGALAKARNAKAAQQHARDEAVAEARQRGQAIAAKPAARAVSTEQTSNLSTAL